MPQRHPLKTLHSNEGPALVLADVIDGADIGMIEGRGRLGFATKASQGKLVAQAFAGKELQGDRAMKANIFRLVHYAHSTTTQLLDNAVVRDGLADHGRDVTRRENSKSMNPSLLARFFRIGGSCSASGRGVGRGCHSAFRIE